RVDRRQEDLRGQVGRPLAVADPAGDEPLQALDVLAVERLEQVGIGADLAQLVGAHAVRTSGDHAEAAAERARPAGRSSFCLHTPYWSRGRKALPVAQESSLPWLNRRPRPPPPLDEIFCLSLW